jgi:hypothetical protein
VKTGDLAIFCEVLNPYATTTYEATLPILTQILEFCEMNDLNNSKQINLISNRFDAELEKLNSCKGRGPVRHTRGFKMLIQLPYVYHADLNDPYGYSQTGWDALAGAIEEGYWEKFEDLLF